MQWRANQQQHESRVHTSETRCQRRVLLAILLTFLFSMATTAYGSETNTEGRGSEATVEDNEQLPSVDSFVPVDVQPEKIHESAPEYPRFAELAGMQGTVWVKVLVDKKGTVRDAVVQKSSGTDCLDRAAVNAAPECKFKPALRDNQPVASWVSYKVDFVL